MALREIFASFGIDFDRSGNLKKGNKAVDRTKGNVRSLTPLVDRLKSGFGALGVAIGGAAAIAQMTSFTRETIRMGDELDKTSSQLGLTARDLQSYRLAAELSGAGTERMNVALANLAKKMFDANMRGGEMADLFRHVGIETQTATGESRGLQEVLADIADHMAGIENPTERVGFAMRIFEENGRYLVPLLQGGSEAMAEMRGELDELGGGMSDLAVRNAVEVQDSLTRLKVTFAGLRSAIAVRMLPTLDWLVKKSQTLVRWFTEIAKKTDKIKRFAKAAGIVLAAAAVATITAWGPVVATITGVSVAVFGLILLVEDLIVWIEGGESATGKLLEKLFGIEEAENILERTQEGFAGIKESVEDLNISLTTIGDTLQTIWDVIEPVIAAFRLLHRISMAFHPAEIIRNVNRRYNEWIRPNLSAQQQQAVEGESLWEGFNQVRRRISPVGLAESLEVNGERVFELPSDEEMIRGIPGAAGGVGDFLMDLEQQSRPASDQDRIARRRARRRQAQELQRRQSTMTVEESMPDVFGLPVQMSIPQSVQTTGARNQTVSIDAPMSVDMTINEATDANEIVRIADARLRRDRAAHAREIAARLTSGDGGN